MNLPLLTTLCALLNAAAATAPPEATGEPGPIRDFGFVASKRVSIHTEVESKAIGPFVEHQRDPADRSFFGFHPFFSHSKDPEADHEIKDYLWPLATTQRNGERCSWRVLLVYGRDWETGEPTRFRWLLFPLMAHGRDSEGKPFLAIMPFGGEVREMFWRDSIRFVLFPLYMSTQVNEQISRSVLWPIISWTRGDGTRRFRIFPLYGHSVEEDKWTRRFVLWPFWNSVRYQYPREQGGGFVLFPLCGRVKTNRQSSWMLIPPFLRWSDGQNFREVMAPWPFVQYQRTEDTRKLYLWPLWGRRTSETVDSSFLLWPFVRAKETRRPATTINSFHLFPFVMHRSEHTEQTSGEIDIAVPEPAQTDPTPTATVNNRYLRLWPLMSYQRDNDVSRLRLLDLWPLRRMRGVEKNWARLWTLYEREQVGDALETELLWGLYRRQKTAEGVRTTSVFPLFDRRVEPAAKAGQWSFLKGLIGREQQGLHRRWTMLYFLKFGRLPQDSEHTPVVDGAAE